MPNNPNDTFDQEPSEDGASTPMLDAATHGQVLDNNNDSGQEKADEMDDSLRTFEQDMNMSEQAAGEIPGTLPKELINPSDTAFTLPEEHS
ncbi:hypothetical protein ACFP2F_10530 [Hymenobacter artigasi]|uniref:Uncharacterized protein n=1 Tax=Hymenobacter artigasi TaxID=2719616 RepID=A0ABX1HKD7_9BACT|nr:hypothetical protein [Hymenobacter artigasi]NKI90295.1 hypothetical protein [Hymenobacter artigasi]